jgi:drug/metabolite transporter (DMT)-like permease
MSDAHKPIQSATARAPLAGLLIAAIAAILFSFKAILAKLMYRAGADAVAVMSLRMLFAGPVFIAMASFYAYRARIDANTTVPLTASERWQVLLLGFLGYYLSSLLDFLGLQYVSASLERLILFLTPTLVALIGWFAYTKPILKTQWQGLALSYAGVALVFVEQLHFNGRHVALGSALIFVAALSYAGYLSLSGALVKKLGSTRLVAYAMSVSSACMLLHFLAFESFATLYQSRRVIELSVLNAIFCTVLPVFLTMEAIRRIGAAQASQLSMLGPVSLLFLGYWLLQEPITLLQVFGTIIVLSGIYWASRSAVSAPAIK